MESNKKNEDLHILIEWEFPEFVKYNRGITWYISVSIIGILLLIYSIITGNFLFASIIIMLAFIYFYSTLYDPLPVRFVIAEEGILLGHTFYYYDNIKNFWIVYKPKEGIANLYFSFKNPLKPNLTIPLQDQNPIKVRQVLLNFLSEDKSVNDESFADFLERNLKL